VYRTGEKGGGGGYRCTGVQVYSMRGGGGKGGAPVASSPCAQCAWQCPGQSRQKCHRPVRCVWGGGGGACGSKQTNKKRCPKVWACVLYIGQVVGDRETDRHIEKHTDKDGVNKKGRCAYIYMYVHAQTIHITW
jgi:hypothetical protein